MAAVVSTRARATDSSDYWVTNIVTILEKSEDSQGESRETHPTSATVYSAFEHPPIATSVDTINSLVLWP